MSSTLTNFLYHYSYFAIFLLSFISSMGIPAGSELAIIGGGALASGEVHKLLSNGQQAPEFFHLSLVVVILVATLGEVLGSMAGYLIGYFRRSGRGRPLGQVPAADPQGPRPGRGLVRPSR